MTRKFQKKCLLSFAEVCSSEKGEDTDLENLCINIQKFSFRLGLNFLMRKNSSNNEVA